VKSIAVVGASVAGIAAARSLRQLGFAGELTVIGDEPHLPYDRPPLSKEFLAGAMTEADLALQSPDEDLGVQWRLGVAATGLDTSSRTLHLSDGSQLTADGIVIATGARARELPDAPVLRGVHQLRSLDDARALRADLVPGARLVVVGAGFIGAEVASTAHGLGLEVTIVEVAPTPLVGPLGAELGAVVAALHTDHGVRLRCGVGVDGLRGSNRLTGVALDNGDVLPADVAVIGIGVVPNVEWLAGSGLQLADGVRCNAFGATDRVGIVAVGDCASWYDPGTAGFRRVEHWTSAREGAAIAAAWLVSGGADARASRAPYFWSDQYGCSVRFAGTTAGFDQVAIEAGTVDERSFLAVYRRGDVPIGVLAIGHDGPFMQWRKRLSVNPAALRPEVVR
jgi:NADPH-dependent 2,4-dienoyl-CoA reductase/sulfur reductase-like enzyme